MSKGFNIEGLDINKLDERQISVKKIVKNGERIDIPMTIKFRINDWGGGYKEYDFLELDDFFISSIQNGTSEQRVAGIDVNEGKGVFTDFIKQFVGGETFYVMGSTPYWIRTFTCEDLPENMIFCRNKQGQEGGSKRRKSKKRKSKRKSKRRRSK